MIFAFDLDGTLCSQIEGYVGAEPYKQRIELVNKLFDEEHTILIYTARGTRSGLDWREVTENQLQDWGVKYHELILGKKPHFDILIDDKAREAEVWFNRMLKLWE